MVAFQKLSSHVLRGKQFSRQNTHKAVEVAIECIFVYNIFCKPIVQS